MLRPGHGLILGVVALLMLGVVMVTSASLSVASEASLSMGDVLQGRPAIHALLAIIMLLIGSRINVNHVFGDRNITTLSVWIVGIILVMLLAVHLPLVGREVHGARRWLNLGPASFQPSEVAKWGLIVVVAAYAVRRSVVMDRFKSGFLVPMILVSIVCGLIATEDLGTAVLIGTVAVALLVAGGAKIWHAAMLAPAAALGIVAAVVAQPYRIQRLTTFLDPYADPQGAGYHMVQSMTAVAGGGLAGRGLGHSIQKFGYLPEDTTDFIFAIICEELGMLGALLVIGLYAVLLICGLMIVRRATHPFQRLLSLGVILTVGLQALINIAVVTGAAPTKGIALPLISSGGTGWVLTAFSFGLLVAIDRAIVADANDVLLEPTGIRPLRRRVRAALATRVEV